MSYEYEFLFRRKLKIGTTWQKSFLPPFLAAEFSRIHFWNDKILKFSILKVTSLETIKLTSMVFLILIGATFFSLVFRGLEGEELIQNLLSYGPDNKYLSLIITLSIMFLLGFILDFIEIIFIIIPLFGPVLFTYGFLLSMYWLF